MLRSAGLSPFCASCEALASFCNNLHTSQWFQAAAALNLNRGYAVTAPSSSSSSSSSSSGSSSAAEPSQGQAQQHPPLYAACVLERLPIIKSPPPAWEAEYKAWLQLHQLKHQQLKQYPAADNKQQEAGSKAASPLAADQRSSSTTGVDSTAANTMKRRLGDKLVLLIKTRQDAISSGSSSAAGAAAAGAPAGHSVWTFPHTSHQPGETMRQAAERALREAIGLSQVYFIGNAPMAHFDVRSSSSSSSGGGSSLEASGSSDSSSSGAAVEAGSQESASSSGPSDGGNSNSSSSKGSKKRETSSGSSSSLPPAAGRVFFHLAQVVNDPWEVELADAAAASDFAWVAKEELGEYLTDERLLQLAHKML